MTLIGLIKMKLFIKSLLMINLNQIVGLYWSLISVLKK